MQLNSAGEWEPVDPAWAGATAGAATGPAASTASATAMLASARVHQQITVSAGTAFKIGFYGAFGVLAAMVVPWFVLFVVIGAGIASLHH